jgi:WhiB family redox-sensing transcriptional regulator
MSARGLRIVPRADAGASAATEREATAVTAAPECPGAVPAPAGAGADPVVPGVERTVTMPADAAALLPLAPLAEERRWTNEAICANGDPDRLFVTGAAQREAAKLCRNCPVQMECLSDALDNRVEFGVWGGLTERQRRALLKRRPAVASWRVVLERARDEARRGVAS